MEIKSTWDRPMGLITLECGIPTTPACYPRHTCTRPKPEHQSVCTVGGPNLSIAPGHLGARDLDRLISRLIILQ